MKIMAFTRMNNCMSHICIVQSPESLKHKIQAIGSLICMLFAFSVITRNDVGSMQDNFRSFYEGVTDWAADLERPMLSSHSVPCS